MNIQQVIKIIFFLVLIVYGIILSTLPYVSVYYTYFAIPALAITALFGFGKKTNIKLKAAMVFLITLIAWIVTLLMVTYVGVYLSRVAAPILLISGLVFVIDTKAK